MAEGWYARDSEIADYLKRRRIIVREASVSFDRSTGLPSDQMDYMLRLNKDLRKLHNNGPALAGKRFDVAYRPLGGYDEAVSAFLSDFY